MVTKWDINENLAQLQAEDETLQPLFAKVCEGNKQIDTYAPHMRFCRKPVLFTGHHELHFNHYLSSLLNSSKLQ